MKAQDKTAKTAGKRTAAPKTDAVTKEVQRETAATREVAGRHKNDGPKDHKGRR